MQIRHFHFLDICRIKSYIPKTVLVSLVIALAYCLLDYSNSLRVAHQLAQSQCSRADDATFQTKTDNTTNKTKTQNATAITET